MASKFPEHRHDVILMRRQHSLPFRANFDPKGLMQAKNSAIEALQILFLSHYENTIRGTASGM